MQSSGGAGADGFEDARGERAVVGSGLLRADVREGLGRGLRFEAGGFSGGLVGCGVGGEAGGDDDIVLTLWCEVLKGIEIAGFRKFFSHRR